MQFQAQMLLTKKASVNQKRMDYQRLFAELPKEPIKWTVNDIQKWLCFIGLENLYPKFKKLAIDGSILSSLTEQDLKEELQVKSSITIKKIMQWIKQGLIEYQQYMKANRAGPSIIPQDFREITHKTKLSKNSSMVEQPPIIHQSSYRSINQEKQRKQPPKHPALTIYQPLQPMQQEGSILDESQGEKKKQYQLIIQQYDGPQTSFFSVKDGGAKIGRHSSNQILILDESISRFHAEIQYKDDRFFLRDTGSTTGTFVKIIEKCQINQGMIFEMGSNQFQAHFVSGNLVLEIIEGQSQGLRIQIPHHRVSIGRKQSNQLYFPDDQHLSNMHATISPIQGKYYIEDMGTTNGTWRRLSLQGQASANFELNDKVVFKIGSSQTYSCKIKTAYVSLRSNPNACIICTENDKDCVYMPCKHNAACIKCSKNLKECPICRNKIEDFIRIYKQ